MRRALALLLIAGLFAAVVPLHRSLFALTQTYPDEFRSYYIPSSGNMKILSLGYHSFWADLIFIWSLLYYDYYGREVRYTYLERTFEVVTDLDPRNREAYVISALFAFIGNRYDLVYRFEDKGIRQIPDDSILAFDAGTYAFFSEKNNARAVRYFSIAAERSPERPIFRKLLAQALGATGNLESAAAYWKAIYDDNRDLQTKEANYYRGTALRHLWDLKVRMDQRDLEAAVKKYVERHGHNPGALQTVVKEGLLARLPLDPAGKPYAYDAAKGAVTCVSPFDFKTAYGQW